MENQTTLSKVVTTRTYAAWREQDQRRETWAETVDRFVEFLVKKSPQPLSSQDVIDIRNAIYNHEVMPSMRLLQFAGRAADRCNVCIYNCSYIAPESLKDLADILYLSLSGCGVGFSVEKIHVNKFPEVGNLMLDDYMMWGPTKVVFEDSREGWCNGFLKAITTTWYGGVAECDYSKIRPKGQRLKTTGGRAGGSELIQKLVDSTLAILTANRGQKLRPIHLHDIICHIGKISDSSAVRRAALISLSDLDDEEMAKAKTGPFWETEPQRTMANNSAVYNQHPTKEQFDHEWELLANSHTGERGIFNRYAATKALPARRLAYYLANGGMIPHLGSNPCTPGYSWVQTDLGPKQVWDLVGIPFNAIVNGRPYPSTQLGFFKTGRKRVWELQTKDGYTVSLTNNHKVSRLTKDGKSTEMVELDNLEVGDRVQLNNHSGFPSWQGTGGTYENGYYLSQSPNQLLRMEASSSDNQRGFIAGVVDRYNLLDNASHNPDLSRGKLKLVQNMLLRFGIMSIVSLYHIPDDTRHYYRLHLPATQYKERILQPSATPTHSTTMYFTTVTGKVDTGRDEDVYDCTIPEVSRFDCNSFVVSNCSEIILQSHSFCNLSEVVCRADDTETSLLRKIRLATIIGTFQSTLCDFKYIDPRWRKNQEGERLLGVSLTGICDSAVVRSARMLELLKDHAVTTNKDYAQLFGISQSLAVTTVKPSGTVSTIVDSSSGIHGRYAPYYIKNLRVSAQDAISKLLIDQGMPWYPEVGQGVVDQKTGVQGPISTYVFPFPIKSPSCAILATDLSPIEQMKLALMVRTRYTEHSVSVSIYVRPNEWQQVGQFVYDNFDQITGMSFFDRDETAYKLTPWEKVTKEEYKAALARVPNIDLSQIGKYEMDADSESFDDHKRVSEPACVGGVCER